MREKTVTVEIEQRAYDEIHRGLEKFGDYEIGGMLIGYKKAGNHFAVSEATVADDAGADPLWDVTRSHGLSITGPFGGISKESNRNKLPPTLSVVF